MHDNSLDAAFTTYLVSKRDFASGDKLSRALLATDLLLDEGCALACFLQHGERTVYWWKGARWSDRDCYVTSQLPVHPRPGDLWLDTVELATAVYLPNSPGFSPDSAGWTAIRPVQAWQFRTFVALARLGQLRTPFPYPKDYLMPARFANTEATDFMTDIYHDEAFAYALWFGKMLTNQGQLINAKGYVQPVQFDDILPSDLRLWDSSLDVEDVRLAIGRQSLDKLPGSEVQALQGFAKLPNPDRMVYAEWYRDPTIGFSTTTLPKLGLVRQNKIYTAYFDLENNALDVAPTPLSEKT